MKARTGDIIEVLWEDSEQVSLGWASVTRYVSAALEEQEYRTSGYLLRMTKHRLVIAQSVDPRNRTVTQVMVVPRSAVKGIAVLGRAHKRVRRALTSVG